MGKQNKQHIFKNTPFLLGLYFQPKYVQLYILHCNYDNDIVNGELEFSIKAVRAKSHLVDIQHIQSHMTQIRYCVIITFLSRHRHPTDLASRFFTLMSSLSLSVFSPHFVCTFTWAYGFSSSHRPIFSVVCHLENAQKLFSISPSLWVVT